MKHGIAPEVAGERINFVIKASKMRDDSCRMFQWRDTTENLQVRDNFGYGGDGGRGGGLS